MERISGDMAIAHLDREDVRTIQAALQDANRRMQARLDNRTSILPGMIGRTYEEMTIVRAMERNEELYNRIAQLTGII